MENLLQIVILLARVGGLLQTVSISQKGFAPQSSSVRYDIGSTRKWLLLAKATNGQRPIGLNGIIGTYSNKHNVFIRASLACYDDFAGIKFYVDGKISADEYSPKFKYKSGTSGVYLWAYMGLAHIDYNQVVSDVLKEQEPDEDAIEITGNIN